MENEVQNNDIEILKAVKQKAEEIVLADPTAANIASYERAKKALEAVSVPPESADVLTFPNRMAALKYLQQEGYCTSKGLIQKSKLYKDSQKGGPLAVAADGSISETALNRYIRSRAGGLVKYEKPVETPSNDGLHNEKHEKEVEKLSEQVEDIRFNREIKQGRYILKSDHELELASRAAALQAQLRYYFHMFSGKILDDIEGVDGRRGRSAMLEEKLNHYLDQALTEFVNLDNYHVIFIDDANSNMEVRNGE